ncbi:MAG: DNA polymerase III subunit delta [Phycisphaeraceae bacterium]|nr:DNA polymerase III subunit delta [Phycisphaerales bacterium]MCB9859572.1 DNA polymerase III subunit delta [Phycisphaeraceae bacterium]
MARKASTQSSPPAQPSTAHRVVILTGADEFLRRHYTTVYRELLEAEHGEVEVLRFDGEQAQPAEVLDELRSFGLMQQYKLVVVESADKFLAEGNRAVIERYTQQPVESATLILRSGAWRPGNLDKMVAEVGAVIKCEPLSVPDATRWAQGRTQKRYEAKLDDDAARALVDRVGVDLGRIDAALGKLAIGAGKGGTITREMVNDMVGVSREHDFWSIQQWLIGTKPEMALSQLRERIDQSPRDAAVPITFACTDLARKIHGMTVGLKQGDNPRSLAGTLKLWGPSFDAVLSASRRADPEKTLALLNAATRADQHQKSGVGDSTRILERLVLQFCAL